MVNGRQIAYHRAAGVASQEKSSERGLGPSAALVGCAQRLGLSVVRIVRSYLSKQRRRVREFSELPSRDAPATIAPHRECSRAEQSTPQAGNVSASVRAAKLTAAERTAIAKKASLGAREAKRKAPRSVGDRGLTVLSMLMKCP